MKITTSTLIPLRAIVLLLAVGTFSGCSIWPYGPKERTSIITPGMRIAAVRETAARAPKADTAEQQQICENLARQIQSESDPLVRQEIQKHSGSLPRTAGSADASSRTQ